MRKRILSVLLVLALLVGCLPASAAGEEIVILFTHDLHSHLLPANDETGASYGGYARLMTRIAQQKEKYPHAILVDAGDFSMGSLFQTAYATDALELRIMGQMGYDVTTFGNHEYDYRTAGFAQMLQSAAQSGDPLPQIVCANYQPPKPGEAGYDESAQAAWDAFAACSVADYTVIERGGVHFAVFGIMGKDAHDCAPMSGMVFADPQETARRVVTQIEAEVPQPRVVVCLSHSGTWEKDADSEDELLAQNVDGIDVIVSAHTHTKLDEPLQVNGTLIVSANEYAKNLGVLRLTPSGDGYALAGYELLPVDATVPEDPAIAQTVEEYKALVSQSYLANYGMTFDQVLAHNPHDFGSQSEFSKNHREAALGNLLADAYRFMVEQAEGETYEYIDFALTADGVVRESLPTGDVTVSDVFNLASLGVGADGTAGYPLVAVYITGKDLKNAFEVDASVQPLMSAAQLHFSGMEFSFHKNRMIFDKVTYCAQVLPDGTRKEIEDDKLYRVVTGLYCGQMLGVVNSKSFGILSVTPRDAAGNPIENLDDFILHDASGRELKEWHAIASYLMHMGVIDERYSDAEGRKVVQGGWNPVELVKNPGAPTLVAMGAGLLILALCIGIPVLISKKHRKKMRHAE